MKAADLSSGAMDVVMGTRERIADEYSQEVDRPADRVVYGHTPAPRNHIYSQSCSSLVVVQCKFLGTTHSIAATLLDNLVLGLHGHLPDQSGTQHTPAYPLA
jgi:hypothetical protein